MTWLRGLIAATTLGFFPRLRALTVFRATFTVGRTVVVPRITALVSLTFQGLSWLFCTYRSI